MRQGSSSSLSPFLVRLFCSLAIWRTVCLTCRHPCEFRGSLITDLWSQGGAHGQTFLDQAPAAFVVGFDAVDTLDREIRDAVEEFDGCKRYRPSPQHDDQFEMAAASHCDRLHHFRSTP